jgi:hypothetical protein
MRQKVQKDGTSSSIVSTPCGWLSTKAIAMGGISRPKAETISWLIFELSMVVSLKFDLSIA